MSPKLHMIFRTVAAAAVFAIAPQARAQDADLELRIQRLEKDRSLR